MKTLKFIKENETTYLDLLEEINEFINNVDIHNCLYDNLEFIYSCLYDNFELIYSIIEEYQGKNDGVGEGYRLVTLKPVLSMASEKMCRNFNGDVKFDTGYFLELYHRLTIDWFLSDNLKTLKYNTECLRDVISLFFLIIEPDYQNALDYNQERKLRTLLFRLLRMIK